MLSNKLKKIVEYIELIYYFKLISILIDDPKSNAWISFFLEIPICWKFKRFNWNFQYQYLESDMHFYKTIRSHFYRHHIDKKIWSLYSNINQSFWKMRKFYTRFCMTRKWKYPKWISDKHCSLSWWYFTSFILIQYWN